MEDVLISKSIRRLSPLLSKCLIFLVLAYLGSALYAMAEPGSWLWILAPAPTAIGMVGYFIVHGTYRFGGRIISVFAAIVFVVSWCFEMLSIGTGFPFGWYHYTEIMRPFIGHVPVFVMPAYMVMGYICWNMAHLLTGCTGPYRRGGKALVSLLILPLVAALLMVVWDLSMDPLRSSLEGRWVWNSGGSHFGIPIGNYFGWLLVTWTMFQIFAFYLWLPSQRREDDQKFNSSLGASFWCTVPAMYLALAVEYLVNPFVSKRIDDYILINGISLPVSSFLNDIALLCSLTMLPIAAVAGVVVWNKHAYSAGTRVSGHTATDNAQLAVAKGADR